MRLFGNMLFLAVLASCVLLVTAYQIPGLPPGPYCDNLCCDGRLDDCSHPILGSRCYCDLFCMRNGTKHDDCCPDYNSYCTDQPAPPQNIVACEHDHIYYFKGEKRMDNCNECTCTAVGGDNAEWQCSQEPCIISSTVLDAVRQQTAGWKASNYTQFWGRKLSDGLKFKLGTLPLSEVTLQMRPDPSYAHGDAFPASFDARTEWPGLISSVYDQGWCGADWAVSTAAVASDRFSIQSAGAENVRLSAQQLVSCSQKRQQGCHGGHIDRAWSFVRKNGLLDDTCFPYVGDSLRKPCPRPIGTLSSAGCSVPSNGRVDRYHTSPPKRLGSTEDIMYEIMTSGPVQAVMTVCQDFFVYREGIYRHVATPLINSEDLCGLHAVRILGWGEDSGDKYWLVANSWGADWGEEGYFRIARGENESNIEHFVLATLALVFEVETYL